MSHPSLQFSLRGVLLALSMICVISAFFPWTGLVVAAYLPVIIGFRLFRDAASADDHVKIAVALGLMTFGWLAGSLILAALANLIKH